MSLFGDERNLDPYKAVLESDPRSFESSDGDILPLADIEEVVEESELDPEELIDPNEGYSEGFIKAQRVIEDGRAASIDKKDITVKVLREDRNFAGRSHLVSMSLGQFLAGSGLRDMVSDEGERKILCDMYLPHEPARNEYSARHLGAAAMPERKKNPVYESGGKRYADPQSAAAGDALDDDSE